MSQRHQVTYQITHIATLIQKKITECNLFLPAINPHDETCLKTNTLLMGMIYAQVTLRDEVSNIEVSQMSKHVF